MKPVCEEMRLIIVKGVGTDKQGLTCETYRAFCDVCCEEFPVDYIFSESAWKERRAMVRRNRIVRNKP